MRNSAFGCDAVLINYLSIYLSIYLSKKHAHAFYAMRSWTQTLVQKITLSFLNSILQIYAQLKKKNKNYEVKESLRYSNWFRNDRRGRGFTGMALKIFDRSKLVRSKNSRKDCENLLRSYKTGMVLPITSTG